MAKRSRATVRPGQRRPIQRRVPAPAPQAGPRPAGLTAAEAKRAEELEAQIRAEESAADAARRAARERARERIEVGPGAASLAAVSHEYDYVARDIRRIGITAGVLLGVLLVIWLLVEVAGVIRIA